MTVQYSTFVRDAENEGVEAAIGSGAGAILRILTGAAPANCAAAETGTALVSINYTGDISPASSGGSKSFTANASGTAVNTGTAGYFRIYNAAGTVCHIQGSVTLSGNGGDITLGSLSIIAGQTVTIGSLSLTAANA